MQDQLKVHCFGCGALNDHGLHIKSRWVGEVLVCRWQPESFQIGHPGFLYGGTIASVIDCHSIWAALSKACQDSGHRLTDGPPAFAFVTGKLSVSYLKPVAVDREIELRARLLEVGPRKTIVACMVLQDGVECANAEVIAVRIKTEVA